MVLLKRLFCVFIMGLFVLSSNSYETPSFETTNHEEIFYYIEKRNKYDKLDQMINRFNINLSENKQELYDKLIYVEDTLENVKAEWLLRIIFRESNANPKAVNPFTRATGIIQWLPSTAKALGTTVDDLYNMSFIEQLDYVIKYFDMINKTDQVNSFEDAYLIVFYPRAIGKPDNYIIGHKNSKIVEFNKTISNNGIITVADVKRFANSII